MKQVESIYFYEKKDEDWNLWEVSFVWEKKTKYFWNWSLKQVGLMQYTGLKDKNWKELYEGDIYELKTWSKVYYRWYIRILDTYSGFRHKTIKTERVHRYKYWPGWNKFEIIWNIYENPDLLNK